MDELSAAGAEFRAFWAQHDARLPATGRHRFHHPGAGVLHLAFEAAAPRADPGLTLLPATADPGSPTEAALRAPAPPRWASRARPGRPARGARATCAGRLRDAVAPVAFTRSTLAA